MPSELGEGESAEEVKDELEELRDHIKESYEESGGEEEPSRDEVGEGRADSLDDRAVEPPDKTTEGREEGMAVSSANASESPQEEREGAQEAERPEPESEGNRDDELEQLRERVNERYEEVADEDDQDGAQSSRGKYEGDQLEPEPAHDTKSPENPPESDDQQSAEPPQEQLGSEEEREEGDPAEARASEQGNDSAQPGASDIESAGQEGNPQEADSEPSPSEPRNDESEEDPLKRADGISTEVGSGESEGEGAGNDKEDESLEAHSQRTENGAGPENVAVDNAQTISQIEATEGTRGDGLPPENENAPRGQSADSEWATRDYNTDAMQASNPEPTENHESVERQEANIKQDELSEASDAAGETSNLNAHGVEPPADSKEADTVGEKETSEPDQKGSEPRAEESSPPPERPDETVTEAIPSLNLPAEAKGEEPADRDATERLDVLPQVDEVELRAGDADASTDTGQSEGRRVEESVATTEERSDASDGAAEHPKLEEGSQVETMGADVETQSDGRSPIEAAQGGAPQQAENGIQVESTAGDDRRDGSPSQEPDVKEIPVQPREDLGGELHQLLSETIQRPDSRVNSKSGEEYGAQIVVHGGRDRQGPDRGRDESHPNAGLGDGWDDGTRRIGPKPDLAGAGEEPVGKALATREQTTGLNGGAEGLLLQTVAFGGRDDSSADRGSASELRNKPTTLVEGQHHGEEKVALDRSDGSARVEPRRVAGAAQEPTDRASTRVPSLRESNGNLNSDSSGEYLPQATKEQMDGAKSIGTYDSKERGGSQADAARIATANSPARSEKNGGSDGASPRGMQGEHAESEKGQRATPEVSDRSDVKANSTDSGLGRDSHRDSPTIVSKDDLSRNVTTKKSSGQTDVPSTTRSTGGNASIAERAKEPGKEQLSGKGYLGERMASTIGTTEEVGGRLKTDPLESNGRFSKAMERETAMRFGDYHKDSSIKLSVEPETGYLLTDAKKLGRNFYYLRLPREKSEGFIDTIFEARIARKASPEDERLLYADQNHHVPHICITSMRPHSREEFYIKELSAYTTTAFVKDYNENRPRGIGNSRLRLDDGKLFLAVGGVETELKNPKINVDGGRVILDSIVIDDSKRGSLRITKDSEQFALSFRDSTKIVEMKGIGNSIEASYRTHPREAIPHIRRIPGKEINPQTSKASSAERVTRIVDGDGTYPMSREEIRGWIDGEGHIECWPDRRLGAQLVVTQRSRAPLDAYAQALKEMGVKCLMSYEEGSHCHKAGVYDVAGIAKVIREVGPFRTPQRREQVRRFTEYLTKERTQTRRSVARAKAILDL